MKAFDRSHFLKLISRTKSPHEGERRAAMDQALKYLDDCGKSWGEVVNETGSQSVPDLQAIADAMIDKAFTLGKIQAQRALKNFLKKYMGG
jgi:hypothetical protein